MKVVRIGRDESNDYVINHPFVSRFHAEIHVDDNGNIVYVDHSSNGSFINGVIVHNAHCSLYGSEIVYLAGEVAVNMAEIVGPVQSSRTQIVQPYMQQHAEPKPLAGGTKPAMKFGQTFVHFFKHYADFSGRARRSEFWYMWLWNIIFTPVFPLWFLATMIPFLALEFRRLHDTGRSGWNILFALIPIVGFILLLVWFASDSERGSNKYGENPKYL